ncbi:putative DUF6536 domain-containing protein [Seiridium unicorne]|uniref:DUF6536 domain-containing protein n=1 Tax=Seiridium unicorne TaxID=138068 RepID=A0ABR2UX67_9PEZI
MSGLWPHTAYSSVPLNSDLENESPTNFGPQLTKAPDARKDRRGFIAVGQVEIAEKVEDETGYKHTASEAWRHGILWCILAGGIIFATTLAITIWAVMKKDKNGDIILYRGKCQTTNRAMLGGHLVINLFSTVLLGACNYCMHILSSPTRKDIDRLHGKKRTAEIGINSISNVFKLGLPRAIPWLILLACSAPLHLVFNSAIFSALGTYRYQVAFVSPSFFKGAPWVLYTDSSLDYTTYEWSGLESWLGEVRQSGLANMLRLEPAACVEKFGTEWVSAESRVIFVTQDENPNVALDYGSVYGVVTKYSLNSSFILSVYPDYSIGYDWQSRQSHEWLCTSDSHPTCAEMASGSSPLVYTFGRGVYGPFSGEMFLSGSAKIDHCLTLEAEEKCTIEASIQILAILLCFSIVKLVVMAGMYWGLKRQPLVVLGDAVASFMRHKDPHTVGACLAPPETFNTHSVWVSERLYKPNRRRWGSAVSPFQWLLCCGLCVVGLTISSYLLLLRVEAVGWSSIFRIGFGVIDVTSTLSNIVGYQNQSILQSALLANTPQLIVSCIYFTYNAVSTSMLQALEWTDYAHDRKPLRVSFPVGEQRSTYRLQMPYRYGVPLMVLIGTIHWLVSQCIFLIRARVYDPDGVEMTDLSIATCGYSGYAMVVAIAVSFVAVLPLVFVGIFRRFKPGMTLVGSNSAAISAACHSKEDEDDDTCEIPVMWGAVRTQGEVGHCCFSSDAVSVPVPGKLYA